MREFPMQDGKYVTIIPNTIFYTKSKYAYIKVQVTSGEEILNLEVVATIKVRSTNTSITLSRRTDSTGTSVFPIGTVSESLINTSGERSIEIDVVCEGTAILTGAFISPINGYTNIEIIDLHNQDVPRNNKPAVNKIVVYPNTGFQQIIYVPSTGSYKVVADNGWTVAPVTTGPFIRINTQHLNNEEGFGGVLTVFGIRDMPMLELKVDCDLCTKGVFLKWIDKSGIPYLYRWSQESCTEELSVVSSYTQLNENIQPYEVQNKTIAKRYRLHSRIVDRELYEMCKTILGNQELWMYDAESADWERCTIEKGEVEDTGASMYDLVIDVVKYIYNL